MQSCTWSLNECYNSLVNCPLDGKCSSGCNGIQSFRPHQKVVSPSQFAHSVESFRPHQIIPLLCKAKLDLTSGVHNCYSNSNPDLNLSNLTWRFRRIYQHLSLLMLSPQTHQPPQYSLLSLIQSTRQQHTKIILIRKESWTNWQSG